MRPPTLLLPTATLLLLPSPTLSASFQPVPLTPPLNWDAGPSLFPRNIIAGYHANLSSHDAASWAAYVLSACEGFRACTSAVAYQATNSGDTGGRFWFGYVFRGGPTDESFYERNEDVTDSAAWTIVR